VDTFVPNDTYLVGGKGVNNDTQTESESDGGVGIGVCVAGSEPKNGKSVMICTGANACGKSVYLKQVRATFLTESLSTNSLNDLKIALIIYMAQVSTDVP